MHMIMLLLTIYYIVPICSRPITLKIIYWGLSVIDRDNVQMSQLSDLLTARKHDDLDYKSEIQKLIKI